MSYIKDDINYFDGWHDGYKHAIDDIRQELLDLPKQKDLFVPMDVFVILNKLIKENEK